MHFKDFQDQDTSEKKELEFFCEKCQDPICNACALTKDHERHAKILLEKAANERKLEIKSVIESQKQNVQQKRIIRTKLGENCYQIEAKAVALKRNVDRFTENLMSVIEAKRKEILNRVEIQVKESVERLRIQQSEVDNQINLKEAAIEKTETLLKRRPSAEIVKLDELALNTIFQKRDSDEGQPVDCNFEGLRQLIFVENETLMTKAVTEGIGSLGKGISEATVGY